MYILVFYTTFYTSRMLLPCHPGVLMYIFNVQWFDTHNIACYMLQIICIFAMLTLLCNIHGWYSSLFTLFIFCRDRPHTHPRDRGIGKEQRAPRGCGPTQSQYHNPVRPTLNYSSGCGGHLSNNNHSSQPHRVRASTIIEMQCYQRWAKHKRTLNIPNDLMLFPVSVWGSTSAAAFHWASLTDPGRQMDTVNSVQDIPRALSQTSSTSSQCVTTTRGSISFTRRLS